VIQELKKAYPDWEVEDEEEEARVEKLKVKRQRGKGAPKKRRSAAGTFHPVGLIFLAVILIMLCYRIKETAEAETRAGKTGAYGLRYD
jgi:hypothetical protein